MSPPGRPSGCLRLRSYPVHRLVLPLLAATVLAAPAAADPGKDDLDQALAKAKKEKKYVSVVFTLFN